MDWQTIASLLLAAGCGAWVLWHASRPFRGGVSQCEGCSASEAPGIQPKLTPLVEIDSSPDP